MNNVVIESGKQSKYCIIWMHGLGADGHDFEDIIPELKLGDLPIKFIFPHAPIIPITINQGVKLRAWYDITSLSSIDRKVDVRGIEKSIDNIHKLINDVILSGITSDNIILAGFSQGGVIATYAALMARYNIRAAIALSTYLPETKHFLPKCTNLSMPIMICHGNDDHVVPVELGLKLNEDLIKLGIRTQWKIYPMQHSVCQQEIDDISQFIHKLFG